jgi:hypothetical protein
MAIHPEASRVVSQFDFSDADINRHVQEFLKQMGMCISHLSSMISSSSSP